MTKKESKALRRPFVKELFRRKSMIFTPGEMAVYTLKPEAFAGLDGTEPIRLRIEKGEN